MKFKTQNTKYGEDVKLQESLFTAGGNGKWYVYFGTQVASYKTKHALPIGSNDHMGLYPNELRTCIHIETYKQIFIAVLFIKIFFNSRINNQPVI